MPTKKTTTHHYPLTTACYRDRARSEWDRTVKTRQLPRASLSEASATGREAVRDRGAPDARGGASGSREPERRIMSSSLMTTFDEMIRAHAMLNPKTAATALGVTPVVGATPDRRR